MSNLYAIGEGVTWEAVLCTPPAEAIPDGLPGRWWVAHTKPRNEKALARDLSYLRVFCYLPLCRRVTRSRNTGRASQSIVPVFPGYLFFNGAEEQRLTALRTNRIANTLKVTDQPELVGQLRQIQKVLAAEMGFEQSATLDVGDWARVIAGPLAGLEGIVSRRVRRLRLVLNVRMLAQSVSVEVPRDLLEKIDGPSYVTPSP
jgi:transcription antitermination factor NusG